MEKVAFISGETFIYWSSIVLTFAVLAAVAVFAGLYLWKSKNAMALSLTVPVAMILSVVFSRFIHWYCRSDSYAGIEAAMTDYTWGGYALLGVFAGCILAACLMRLLRVTRNLPQMLDCMAIAGGVGIAAGRVASFFNTSDRGMVVPESWGLPFACEVTNAVSGAAENRLATFMLQSVTTAVIVAVLVLVMLGCALLRKKLRDGDITLLFLLFYGTCQVVLDSTRYDSLFMRSNGFISFVQIFGCVALLIPLVIFSVRMVKARGMKWQYGLFWLLQLGAIGGAGYMEYYVQRHGDQAAFAYSVMSACLVVMVSIALVIRALAVSAERAAEIQAD